MADTTHDDQKSAARAGKVAPGAGYFLAALVILGGLVFNIGNIGGTALDLWA